jgi:hypothetical protein
LDALGKRQMYIWDIDMGPGLEPPLVPPGTYSIELKVGDKVFKQNVEVLKDPNTSGTIEDIQKQNVFALKLYESVKTCFTMIDEMENTRAKLLYIIDSSNSSKEKKLQAVKLENDLWKLEGKVHDIFQTGAREDIFRNPAKLLERFLAISKESYKASADFQPTDQDLEVYDKLATDLKVVDNDYNTLKMNLKEAVPEIKIKSKVNRQINKR